MAGLSGLFWVGVAVLGLGAVEAAAQDARTVTEPMIPASCTVLQAQQSIFNGEPSSETTLDTTRIQSALTGCASGQAVELATNGANNAFLIGPITLPAGVTLLVDGGVTVFGSRNPADYQVTTAGVETCGTVGPAGNGCLALITASAANAAIMGYGVIDGRGQDKLLVNGAPATYSWWDNASTAQLNNGDQNNPILVSANAANLVLYKITFRNSPMFHVKWSGNLTNKTGFTAWGVKVITPFSAEHGRDRSFGAEYLGPELVAVGRRRQRGGQRLEPRAEHHRGKCEYLQRPWDLGREYYQGRTDQHAGPEHRPDGNGDR